MTIAEFVKERRKKLGMTQVTLADRAGVGLRFVRDLEQGKTTLRLDKVNQVLQIWPRRFKLGNAVVMVIKFGVNLTVFAISHFSLPHSRILYSPDFNCFTRT